MKDSMDIFNNSSDVVRTSEDVSSTKSGFICEICEKSFKSKFTNSMNWRSSMAVLKTRQRCSF